MFRNALFFYCTILLVGTFVYSKPYDSLTELNDGNMKHENVLFSVGNSDELELDEQEIIEKEPVIFDISTHVAKFILHFIKKYCKNSEKIGYLQNLITTKGLGSLFENSSGGNIEPNFAYSKNGGPQNIGKQGHAIKYKFATAPSYKLQAPTIKVGTKNFDVIQRVEQTTENIHVPKQYKMPKIQTIHQQQLQLPQQSTQFYIEGETQRPEMKEHIYEYSMVKPNHHIVQVDYEHANPEFLEPMYEYGNTEDEYSLPDYDYSMFHDNDVRPLKPQVSIKQQQQPPVVAKLPSNAEQSAILTDWFKYIEPENDEVQRKMDSQEMQPEYPKQVVKFKMPEQSTINVEQKEPGIFEDLLNYLIPEEKPEYPEEIQEMHELPDDAFDYKFAMPTFKITEPEPQRKEITSIEEDQGQPQVKQHVFEYSTLPTTTKQPDNWLHYQQQVQPNINVETPEIQFIDHHQPDLQEPLVKHVFEHSAPPDTRQPDNWLHYQQTQPKINVNVEPEVQFIDHHQPNHQEPLIKQHVFEYSTLPNARQTDSWLHYQQRKINANVETPEVYFIDHQQPDFQEPLLTHREYSSSEAKPEVSPKVEAIQGPEVEFIGHHVQPDDTRGSLMQPHTFELTSSRYEPSAEVKHPELEYNTFKHSAPQGNEEREEHTSNAWLHFKNQVPHVTDSYSIPEYQRGEVTTKIEGKTQVYNHEFDVNQPQIQEHTLGYQTVMVPHVRMHKQYHAPQMDFHPSTKIKYEHSTIENPWTVQTKYWLPNAKTSEIHFNGLNDERMNADDLWEKYTIELQHLNEMKPHFKDTITGPKYVQFIDNIDKMNNVLNVWKNGGKFYDIPNIEYVKKTMTELSNDSLRMLQIDHAPGIVIKPQTYGITTTTMQTTTQQNKGVAVLRRTFDGAEELNKYLEDPKSKEDFSTLDVKLQNAVLAYIGNAELTDDHKLRQLMLLRQIKHIMTKYQKLFQHLTWVDEEIANLAKETAHLPPEMMDSYKNNLYENGLDQMRRMDNNMNFKDNSNIFLTLLNIPFTVNTKSVLKNLIHKLFKDIVDVSEIYPEFKNIRYYLGEQTSIENTLLYKRLVELSTSPKEFVDGEVLDGVRRSNVETEIEVTTEIQIEETTQAPAPPQKKIEKHHNIFREFLMDNNENTNE